MKKIIVAILAGSALYGSGFGYDNASSPYGICAHLGGEGDIRSELKAIQSAGIGWVRMDMTWGAIQPQRGGAYTFTRYDDIIHVADSLQIGILPILDYNAAYGDTAWKHLDEWSAYVSATVGHFNSSLKYWEVWNEENISFWKDETTQKYVHYEQLLSATYTAVKTIDPGLHVLLGGLAMASASPWGVPYGYLDSIYTAGAQGSIDIMNTHPYRWWGTDNVYPEYFMPYADRIGRRGTMYKEQKDLRTYFNGKGGQAGQMWVTEVGYPTLITTKIPGETEDQQARWLPRTYLSLFQAGVSRVFWYEFANSPGTNDTDPEWHFGLTYSDFSAKPGINAYKTLTRLRPAGSTVLDTGRWRSADSSIYYPHWQRPDGKTVWALWRPEAMGGRTSRALALTGTLDSAFTYLGKDTTAALKAAISNGTLTLNIDSMVIFLVGPKNINGWGSGTSAISPSSPPRTRQGLKSGYGRSQVFDIRGKLLTDAAGHPVADIARKQIGAGVYLVRLESNGIVSIKSACR